MAGASPGLANAHQVIILPRVTSARDYWLKKSFGLFTTYFRIISKREPVLRSLAYAFRYVVTGSRIRRMTEARQLSNGV